MFSWNYQSVKNFALYCEEIKTRGYCFELRHEYLIKHNIELAWSSISCDSYHQWSTKLSPLANHRGYYYKGQKHSKFHTVNIVTKWRGTSIKGYWKSQKMLGHAIKEKITIEYLGKSA